MKKHGSLLVLGAVFALLVGGMAVLFQRRVGHGDVFPVYSSLRADPLGLRALHDGLAQLPGLRVERRFKPLPTLEPNPARTLVLAGIGAGSWKETTREEFDALDAAVRAGSRLVLAMQAEAVSAREKNLVVPERNDDTDPDEPKDAKEKLARKRAKKIQDNFVDLNKRWGVKLEQRWLMDREGPKVALRAVNAHTAGLPERVTWQSDVYFTPDAAAGWNVIYRRGGQPVLLERRLGLGTIVLAADSYFLSNEALQRDRASPLLAWIVGPHARVVFDEAHLGVMVENGIASLARRYGLSGAFFTLVLLAALFVWRRMALFVPPAPETRDVALNYHPAAGLEALLRRAVPADQLTAACATEWKPTARESDRARVAAALAAEPLESSVVRLYNAAVRALRRK